MGSIPIWCSKAQHKLLGVPAYRLAGIHSLANSEFSTQAFELPSQPLWVNADVSWSPDPTGTLEGLEGCSAYLMVAVLDATSEQVLHVPGFERERCVMMNVSGTRLKPVMPVWNGSAPVHEHTSLSWSYYECFTERQLSLLLERRTTYLCSGRDRDRCQCQCAVVINLKGNTQGYL